MWVFTTKGFISVVQHRDDPDVMIVRARRREHLEAITQGEVSETPEGDYRFRIQVRRSAWVAISATLASQIDYPNFKGSVEESEYHDALLDVWSTMRFYQEANRESHDPDANGSGMGLVSSRGVR